MKSPKSIILAASILLTSTLTLSSCNSSNENEVEEKVTYQLDLEKSSLAWKGAENEEYFHTGVLNFKDGIIEMMGDKVLNGNFSIDLNTLTANDKTLPDEKKEMLASHLKDTSFFFVADYPTIKVSVKEYNEGKLTTVISVRGVEIEQQLPVELKKDESSMTIKGKFNVNLAPLKMKGMEPDPESGEKIQDDVAFDLNLVLKK
jgi:hypothetical protein